MKEEYTQEYYDDITAALERQGYEESHGVINALAEEGYRIISSEDFKMLFSNATVNILRNGDFTMETFND